MTELADHELLAEFARNESEAAFAELTGRYVNLVYSAGLRYTGNPHHAEEITQAVFIVLARKAGSLRRGTILSGWLYQTARLTAANFIKGEIRREQRDQEAYMQSTLNEPDRSAWQQSALQIAPLLDEAMGKLGETDRNAVVLRYFENKTAQEVGAALKLNEAAAHKRVNRAVEKLRKFFTKRGVTLSAAALAGVLAATSVQAAPVGLAATNSSTTGTGAAVGASITTLAKATLNIMTYAKLKLAGGLGAAILLAGGATSLVFSQGSSGDNLSIGEIFKKSQFTYAALTSYRDDGTSVATVNGTTITHIFTTRLARPSLYRIEWQQSSVSANFSDTTSTQAVWSAGQGDFGLNSGGTAAKYKNRETALSGATGISGGAAGSIPGTFFNENWGNRLKKPAANETRLPDEKVGDVECYVLSSEVKGQTETLLIGKTDFLIHQIRSETSLAAMKAVLDKANARQIAAHPEMADMLKQVKPYAITSAETHEHIVLNESIVPADFAH